MSQAFRPQHCGEDMLEKSVDYQAGRTGFICNRCPKERLHSHDWLYNQQRQFVRADMAALNARIEAEVAAAAEGWQVGPPEYLRKAMRSYQEEKMANTNPACGCTMQDLMMNGCPSAGGGACPSVVKAPTPISEPF